jgi:lysophospholipase L1-like esterase
MNEGELRPQKERAVNSICEFIESDIYQEALKRNIRLVVVFHPIQYEISENENPYQACIDRLKSNQNIVCIDLTNALKQQINPKNINEYYWPLDGHFTPKGYNLMAKILTDSLHAHEIGPRR